MPALASFVGGMAEGRLAQIDAEREQQKIEHRIAAAAKITRDQKVSDRKGEISLAMREVERQVPNVTSGQLAELEIKMLSMSARTFGTQMNAIFNPERGFTLTGSNIKSVTAPTYKEPGRQAQDIATQFMSGSIPSFANMVNMHLGKDSDTDYGDISGSLNEQQELAMQTRLEDIVQTALSKGVRGGPLVSLVAKEYAKAGTVDKSWLSFLPGVSDDYKFTMPTSIPQASVTTEKVWTKGSEITDPQGRKWRWLGGPEGPYANPNSARDRSNWAPL
jgi:hypothetical protein